MLRAAAQLYATLAPSPWPLQVSSHRSFYPRAHALLLPFTLPLMVLATTASLAAAWTHTLALCFAPLAFLMAGVVSCFYPPSGQYGSRTKREWRAGLGGGMHLVAECVLAVCARSGSTNSLARQRCQH